MTTTGMERPAWKLIADQIAVAREELGREADALAKWYEETVKQAKRSLPRADQPKYYFKLRKNNGISMYWVKTSFIKKDGKHIPLHEHIKSKGQYRHPRSTFRQAGEWELDLIDEVESRAERIRKELALAAALSRVMSGRTGHIESGQ